MGAHPQIDVEALLADVTRGEASALDFCRGFFAFAHLADDVIDKQVKERWTMPQFSNACLAFAAVLGLSGFFQTHKAYLLPLIEVATIAYLESEETADPALKRFLATEYFVVLLGVARIVGGWDHAREISATWGFARE